MASAPQVSVVKLKAVVKGCPVVLFPRYADYTDLILSLPCIDLLLPEATLLPLGYSFCPVCKETTLKPRLLKIKLPSSEISQDIAFSYPLPIL